LEKKKIIGEIGENILFDIGTKSDETEVQSFDPKKWIVEII